MVWIYREQHLSDDDWVKICQQLLVEGKAGRERGRKTWLECVRKDVKELGLKVGAARLTDLEN